MLNEVGVKELIRRSRDRVWMKQRYYEHTIARLKSRFNKNWNEKDYNAIIKKVRAVKGVCLWSLSRDKKIWLVVHKRHFVTVMYNADYKELETAFPEGFSLKEYLIHKGIIKT